MLYFGIPNKVIRLTKATMQNSTYYVKRGTIVTDGFKVGTGLKQGDGLATNLFNPYPTAFPYGNGMVLHFYQQQESSTTKTVHKVINKGRVYI